MQDKRYWLRWLLGVMVGFGLAIASLFIPALSQSSPSSVLPLQSPSPEESAFPAAQIHPLPPTLAQWAGSTKTGDYFDQVKPVSVGYLVWSRFPVSVFIQPVAVTETGLPFVAKQAKDWEAAVWQAVQEWNRYLPLQRVEQASEADITFWRSPPPLRVDRSQASQSTGDRVPLIIRARTAETRFELYTKPLAGNSVLAHKFTILLRPDQSPTYLLAAARHELGHALGIWGHSPSQQDVLYFSQVRNPPLISPRDVNTLKRVYEQPTRLGWSQG